TRTLIPFLTMIQNTFGYLPEYIVADAGYGSEQNYMAIIDDFNKTPLITYGMFIKVSEFIEFAIRYRFNNFINMSRNIILRNSNRSFYW
ncbi:hypothetical protein AAGW68_13980, partial [Staphylococcus aureus]